MRHVLLLTARDACRGAFLHQLILSTPRQEQAQYLRTHLFDGIITVEVCRTLCLQGIFKKGGKRGERGKDVERSDAKLRKVVERHLKCSVIALDVNSLLPFALRNCTCNSFTVEASSPDSTALCLWVAPNASTLHHSLTFRSSQYAKAEMVRQYRVRCRMAVVMTLGGGWASVRNAKESLRCALELHDLGREIGECNTMRKCRIFVGWALVWHAASLRARSTRCKSDALELQAAEEALEIFSMEMQSSVEARDESNFNRCFAALRLWHYHNNNSITTDSTIGEGSEDRSKDRDAAVAPRQPCGPEDAENDVLDEWRHLFNAN